MPGGNEKCPCGSGKKFKRCCRDRDRPPETCHFCGRKEPEVSGEYVRLVKKDKTEEPGFACTDCIEKRRDKTTSFAGMEIMVLASMWANKRR